MTCRLTTTDNNIASPLLLTAEQREGLSCLSGRKLKELTNEESDGGLLVFPQDFNLYGDKIGDDVLFEIKSDQLFTGNLMGFIGCNDVRLKIGSRFDKHGGDNFMHYMLERVLAINLFDLNHDTAQDDVFDFLPFLFPFCLKNALAQGIFREYVTHQRNDSHMKGALEVNRHVRLNYPSNGNIAYRYREFSRDNSIMQLVRHTIEHIRAKDIGDSILNCDEDTRICVSQVVESTPSYDRHELNKVVRDNLRSKIHPYYSDYEPLRILCLQILRNEELKYGSDSDVVNGIIFDGAWLWEEYLNTVIAQCGLTHPRNKTGEGRIYLFKNHKGIRYPDFIGEDIILDAKYKSYSNNEVQNISGEDLHQVITYMYITRRKAGGFIYPKNDEGISDKSETLEGYGGPVHLIGLPVSCALGYKEFKKAMARNEEELCEIIKMIQYEERAL